MSTTFDDDSTGVAILNRVIEPDETTMTVDAARTLLTLRFQQVDKRRMNRLAAKARKGTLTDEERWEADQYNLVSHMLALLQARARKVLKERGANSPGA